MDVNTPEYTLRLGEASGVAVGLLPKNGNGFDFLPSDRLAIRNADGFVHLGDMTLRARPVGAIPWSDASTYVKRVAVLPVRAEGNAVAAYDLTPTLPAGFPLKVTRVWSVEKGKLRLSFKVSNPGSVPIELGGLGIPMPFNNIITDRSLEEAHARCSFTDPYIGADAGYLQVSRLAGVGPTMVVTPVGKTPLEAWRPIGEPMPTYQTFEGMMEWTVHTKAWAENEWKAASPWNQPTAAVLEPGESRTYGVQFQLAPSVRKIEDVLDQAGRPVAIGLPGYVLPQDQEGRLFLKYGKKAKSLTVEPRGAMEWRPNGEGKNGWKGYTLKARGWGRARLSVEYADGTRQTVSYYLTKPAATAVADLGRFLTTKSWFTDEDDPFGRAPSAITYDHEAGRQVTQEARAWIAGLSDEAGAGSWLALGMKEFGQADPGEVAKYEEFVDKVLWGNLQVKDGRDRFGVRKSVFFHDPKALPNYPYDASIRWDRWASWNKEAAGAIDRAYNYPHVVAAYWAMYRVARNHPGLTKKPWSWYLDQAYGTTEFMTSRDDQGKDRVGYWRLGLMDGTVFVALLDDLKREGWGEKAALIEARMKERADRWKDEAYPFGSEMAWDSTGQEEVYAWCKYFGHEDKAQVSLSSILAYTPTVPHWGYNGNARRYWDFGTGGKLQSFERQIHHYGSGLNAIPVLSEYRQRPDDLYLLRVGYGGAMGALSNIHEDGFASVAFHSFPDRLKWDAYSGDYGPNFFGHALNAATYLVNTKDFGWQAFGGRVSKSGDRLRVEPQDAFRKRIYLAPVGLYLTLDAGTFEAVEFDAKSRAVKVTLSPATVETPNARLRIEHPAKDSNLGKYVPTQAFMQDAGAYSVPLASSSTLVEIKLGEG